MDIEDLYQLYYGKFPSEQVSLLLYIFNHSKITLDYRLMPECNRTICYKLN